jgi:RNA recognition motif-containing protein
MRENYTSAKNLNESLVFSFRAALDIFCYSRYKVGRAKGTLFTGQANPHQGGNMTTRIYVENLPSDITVERLKDLFAQIGEVQSVSIGADLLSRRPNGSCTIDMTLDIDAYRVVNCFEGATFKDRKIHLKEEQLLFQKARTAFTNLVESYERMSTEFKKEHSKTN